jgi:hypothetical protein
MLLHPNADTKAKPFQCDSQLLYTFLECLHITKPNVIQKWLLTRSIFQPVLEGQKLICFISGEGLKRYQTTIKLLFYSILFYYIYIYIYCVCVCTHTFTHAQRLRQICAACYKNKLISNTPHNVGSYNNTPLQHVLIHYFPACNVFTSLSKLQPQKVTAI